MSETDRATWRRRAEECVALARITTAPADKQLLLTRAQEWLKLAYSDGDAEFERVLLAFNQEQMAVAARPLPMTQRTAIQQQPAQHQQAKIQPDDNGSCNR